MPYASSLSAAVFVLLAVKSMGTSHPRTEYSPMRTAEADAAALMDAKALRSLDRHVALDFAALPAPNVSSDRSCARASEVAGVLCAIDRMATHSMATNSWKR